MVVTWKEKKRQGMGGIMEMELASPGLPVTREKGRVSSDMGCVCAASHLYPM